MGLKEHCSGAVLALVCGLTGVNTWAQEDTADERAAPSGERAYQDCVVVVLDASGSMGDRMGATARPKMEAAKEALKRVLAGLPSSTQVGVLVFSGENVRTPWVWPLGPRGTDAELAAAIDPIEPGGATPLGMFLKLGADELLKRRAKQYGYGSYRLLVVTDGDASDPDLVARYAPDIVSRGISLDVIGVDMARDHTLKAMAHSYRRADDPSSLERAVQEVFAEVSAEGQPRGASVSESAFAVIAGLEPEIAMAIISALASSGNQAIGEQPPVARASAPPKGRAGAGGASPAPRRAVPSSAADNTRVPAPDDAGGSGIPWKAVALIMIAAIVIHRIWRKKNK